MGRRPHPQAVGPPGQAAQGHGGPRVSRVVRERDRSRDWFSRPLRNWAGQPLCPVHEATCGRSRTKVQATSWLDLVGRFFWGCADFHAGWRAGENAQGLTVFTLSWLVHSPAGRTLLGHLGPPGHSSPEPSTQLPKPHLCREPARDCHQLPPGSRRPADHDHQGPWPARVAPSLPTRLDSLIIPLPLGGLDPPNPTASR